MTDDYAPESRRPIARMFRRTADGATHWCVGRDIHPDTISYASIGVSAAAGVAFWQSGEQVWLVIPAAVLCYLRLWLNMLDGMVALASGKASPRGEILNELPDRASDVLIFVGVAHSGLAEPVIAYWVIITALLTAYVGIFGQAVGAGRQFAGIMAKPWRLVALHVGSWVMALLMALDVPSDFGGLSVLDWTLLVIAAGCLQTVWVRLRRILMRVEGG